MAPHTSATPLCHTPLTHTPATLTLTMAPLEATVSRNDMGKQTKPAMINYVAAIFA